MKNLNIFDISSKFFQWKHKHLFKNFSKLQMPLSDDEHKNMKFHKKLKVVLLFTLLSLFEISSVGKKKSCPQTYLVLLFVLLKTICQTWVKNCQRLISFHGTMENWVHDLSLYELQKKESNTRCRFENGAKTFSTLFMIKSIFST